MYGYLVAIIPQLLDILVVGVLMGDVEGAVDGTAIGIGATLAEQLAIQVPVLIVDSIIKRKGHHLRHLGDGMGEDTTTDSSKLCRKWTHLINLHGVQGKLPDRRKCKVENKKFTMYVLYL